jgi:hypothetical protein
MKKSSLLLQRPVRTFDEDPEPLVPTSRVEPEILLLQQKPVIADELRSAVSVEPKPRRVPPPSTSPGTNGGANPSEKFGPLTVDLAKAKKREAKGLLTTTVPSLLHGRLMQQEEGPSGFINRAVQKHLRSNLNRVVEAGYRLAALRVAQAEDSRTISARAPMTYVVDVDDAVKYVTQNLEKVSAAFIVGGCVMLQAEEQGLVSELIKDQSTR